MTFMQNTRRDAARRAVLVLVGAACAATVPCAAEAQYFGRNKVQYDDLRFTVLRTSHFDLYHYLGDGTTATDAARMAERWNVRLADVLSHTIESRQPVILYADHAGFQQTNVIEGMLDESTGGVTESMQRRVVMPLGVSHQDTDHVLGHELVHAYQYDIAARTGGIARMSQLPLWTIEGMAEYLTVGRTHTHTAMWLRDAVLHDDVPTLRRLSTDGRYFPYRFGHAVWAYIGGRWGDARIGDLYRAALREGWDRAVPSVLGVHADSLSEQWRAAVMDTYRPLLEGRTPPDSVGRRIAVGRRTTGEMMLAPAASPDGRLVAFLWARDFSIDLYLADTRSGTVLRRLASGAAQSRFDALSYMGSAGTWSPDGVQFATVVFADGGQELAIIDVASGRIQRRIRVADVNGIASPAWSPDGRSIAFSGATGGRRDLYLLDVATGRARRLTDDAFAELQPAWSPDGGTIAFTTDRDDIARFERLEHASMRIGLFDVATGAVRTLSLVGGAAADPQFSPDGRSLFFLAAPDGFRDLYRADLETGAVFRVTRVATGISGLTPVSPALSVAPGTGDVFFTLFDRRGYVITALDAASARGGEAFSATNAAPERAAVLPPGSTTDAVETYLADVDRGMPDVAEFTSSDYRARPKLSHVGVPSLGVGIDRYSTGVYASVEAYFTDVLGDHGLYTNAIANGGWGELGGQLFYENRSRRLNWGVGVGHVPYLNRAVYAQPVRGTDGSGGTLITEYRERLVYDEAGASARYPLSTTRRIEVSAGVQRIAYEYELNRRIESGGRIVDQQSIDLIAPIRLNMAQAGIALVGDHSIFGIASPVDGGRYRFEVQPTVGTLDFVAATADWRIYTYRRPFTLAVRALHYGRYGPDAERAELGLLYLGSQGLVRGYDYQSYTAAECAAPAGGPTGCGALDRLFGSRLAVAGVELRAPLFGNERIGLFNVAFLPTELAVFFDAGAAWSADRSFSLDTGAAGGPVMSAGLSARFNLFGAMILETYYALPLQRTTGGRFGFQLTPGW